MQPSVNEIISPKLIRGLTGNVRDVSARIPAPTHIQPASVLEMNPDIDLRRMAQWAMNYLIRTPNEQFDYEPVFQCHPLQCPPVPSQRDVVVPCDTDARMFWEWDYMRHICGSTEGKQVEAAFQKRRLVYVQADGGDLGAFSGAQLMREGLVCRLPGRRNAVHHRRAKAEGNRVKGHV